MNKILAPLSTAAALLLSVTAAFPTPFDATEGNSYEVFFNAGGASLSKEAVEITLVAAKKFLVTHDRHSAMQILVTTETGDQDSALLANERVKAVSSQLIRDGIQNRFVISSEQASVHSEPVRAQEWLNRRVSIRIEDSTVLGQL